MGLTVCVVGIGGVGQKGFDRLFNLCVEQAVFDFAQVCLQGFKLANQVKLIQPEGLQTPPPPDPNDPRTEVVQAFPTLVFGNTFLGSIHGYTFEDVDAYAADDTEPRLPGVEITLLGTDGMGNTVFATTTTDANGEYAFTDLLPGDYTVTETPPWGSIATTSPWSSPPPAGVPPPVPKPPAITARNLRFMARHMM